jgi:uncharacterized protein YndB with AHSA1/START domain
MPATPQSQLTGVTRTVTPTAGGHVVALAQTFPVGADELWSALTTGSRLALWFGRASGELVEDGRYELPDMETHGRVKALEAPRRLLLSWEFGAGRSELELLLEPAADADEEGDATRFTLHHRVPADAHWATFGPAATGCGWDAALYPLALHLEDPSTPLLRQMGDFAASREGAEFVRATAEAWYEAHVASGVDRKPARKASVRTAAFYLGEETDLA